MVVLGIVALLGWGYYNWKDHIEDALLAKVQLDAMMEAEQFKQDRYAEAQKIIKDQAVRERSRELAALNMLQYIKENTDETSCIVKPMSATDVRVLTTAILQQTK
jgi:predicted negative regulator of RcsB-dependent stress response